MRPLPPPLLLSFAVLFVFMGVTIASLPSPAFASPPTLSSTVYHFINHSRSFAVATHYERGQITGLLWANDDRNLFLLCATTGRILSLFPIVNASCLGDESAYDIAGLLSVLSDDSHIYVMIGKCSGDVSVLQINASLVQQAVVIDYEFPIPCNGTCISHMATMDAVQKRLYVYQMYLPAQNPVVYVVDVVGRKSYDLLLDEAFSVISGLAVDSNSQVLFVLDGFINVRIVVIDALTGKTLNVWPVFDKFMLRASALLAYPDRQLLVVAATDEQVIGSLVLLNITSGASFGIVPLDNTQTWITCIALMNKERHRSADSLVLLDRVNDRIIHVSLTNQSDLSATPVGGSDSWGSPGQLLVAPIPSGHDVVFCTNYEYNIKGIQQPSGQLLYTYNVWDGRSPWQFMPYMRLAYVIAMDCHHRLYVLNGFELSVAQIEATGELLYKWTLNQNFVWVGGMTVNTMHELLYVSGSDGSGTSSILTFNLSGPPSVSPITTFYLSGGLSPLLVHWAFVHTAVNASSGLFVYCSTSNGSLIFRLDETSGKADPGFHFSIGHSISAMTSSTRAHETNDQGNAITDGVLFVAYSSQCLVSRLDMASGDVLEELLVPGCLTSVNSVTGLAILSHGHPTLFVSLAPQQTVVAMELTVQPEKE
jgi:hypothetical protein